MKPNFEAMTSKQLTAYILAHRDDDEAIRVLFSRRNPPDSEATWYGPMVTEDGTPIEENIRIAEEAIKQRIEQLNQSKQDSQS
jgi:redox-sensitive bicupin YhaK (pirin superfamily)